MRRIGLALLVVSAGCNQVFGIKDTDRLPDAALPEFTGKMRWAAAKTVNGAPMGVDVFPIGNEAVDSAPLSLKIGPALGMGELADAPYDVATGTFHFGFMLAGQPWRLVYTLPGDTITHEVQWSVQTPDLIIPRMTRMGATPPPTGSGYDVIPSPATTFSGPFVATSGAFTASFAMTFAGNEVRYAFPDEAIAINGPVSAPDATDWVLAADWAAVSGTLQQLTGWGTATGVALTGGALTAVNPSWITGPLISIRPAPGLTPAKDRIRTALKALDADDSNVEYAFYPHMTYGLSPNLEVYGFVEPPADCGTPVANAAMSGVDCLSRPAMIPLADDSAFDLSIRVPALDGNGIPNPPVMYARVTQTRPIHGVALTSGIQSLVRAPATPATNETIDLLSSTVSTAALVDQVALDSADLSGATGPTSPDVEVPGGAMPRTLMFHPRLGQDGAPMARADDFVVTLYQIQNPDTSFAKLHAVRVYHLTDYTLGVKIDGALLMPGIYAFSITSRVGFPNAGSGDFKTVAYPLGESTAFSRQFVVH